MTTSTQRNAVYDRADRMTSVEEIDGWIENVQRGGAGPDRPYPDEIPRLLRRKRDLLAKGVRR